MPTPPAVGNAPRVTGSAPANKTAAPKLQAADLGVVRDALKDKGYLDLNSLPNGYHSDQIATLQTALGMNPADGTLNQETRDAFAQWQQSQKTGTDPSFVVDMKVGQQSWAGLMKVPGHVDPGQSLLGGQRASTKSKSSSFQSGSA